MKVRTIFGSLAAVASLATVVTVVIAVSKESATKLPTKPRITVSKATTYLTAPVDDEGYVDYIEALNRESGKGVTPEKNAAVFLLRALGPTIIPQRLRAQFFKRIGIEALPDQGAYYVSLYASASKLKGAEKIGKLQQLNEQYDKCISAPWKRTQFPDIHKWLVANEEPLEQIELAAKHQRFFLPLVRAENRDEYDSLGAIPAETYYPVQGARKMLVARATMRIGEGRTAAALQDLLTIHRLGRLFGEEPMGMSSLRANSLDSYATWQEVKFAQTGRLTFAQATAYRAKLDALGPFATAAKKSHTTGRIELLDFATRLARNEKPKDDILELFPDRIQGKTAAGGKVIRKESPARAAIKRAPPIHQMIDWNIVTTDINTWFDRVKVAAETRDLPTRMQALTKLGDENLQLSQASRQTPAFLKRKTFKPIDRELASRWLANVLIGRVGYPGQYVSIEIRANIRYDLSRVAFALAAHRALHGKYPDKLSKLAPKCISEVPIDPFSGKALSYIRTKTGYVLYSVGFDGRDDGGRAFYDSVADVQFDDIAIGEKQR